MKDKDNKRILVFNVNWLGDVLFSTPAIRNIRRNFPDSFIACVIPSRCYPILKDNPNLDEIIIFDEYDRHKGLLGKMDFIRLLKSKKFDTAYLLHRSFSRTLICRLADIPERIGHYTRKRGFLLTKKIDPPKKDSCHRIDYYLSVIERAGLKVEDRHLDFYFSDEDAAFVENFLNKFGLTDKDLIIAINAGGNWFPKRWPKENWALLADSLIGDLGAKVVITGSLSDMKLAHDIRNLMKHKPIIACGQLSIKQLGALFKKADLLITADTGPLHIASAVGAKNIIALFGPTSVEITGPLPRKNITVISKDIGCKIPCYQVHCKDSRCMKAITIKDVLQQAAKIRK
jgi:lipopolysaccharide heptosyltransferase II